MNTLRIVIQSDQDEKDLYKKGKLGEGLTAAIIQNGTKQGQIAVEFMINIDGHVTSAVITENNFDGLVGAVFGAKVRFNRLPIDEMILVKQYFRQKSQELLKSIPNDGRLFTRSDFKQFIKDLDL